LIGNAQTCAIPVGSQTLAFEFACDRDGRQQADVGKNVSFEEWFL
jgi:hypothetical protein